MRGEIISLGASPSTVNFTSNSYGQLISRTSSILLISVPGSHLTLNSTLREKRCPSSNGIVPFGSLKFGSCRNHLLVRSGTGGNEGDDDDDELCPVECVREFKSDEEFIEILDKAKKTNALVVVDFYRTSCGSCKYIEQGFSKLCKASGDDDVPVIFLKHNVIDEYDERSDVAERLRIKTVPLFHFYKNGTLLEAFATRDKDRINEAISRYTSTTPQNA